MVELEVLGHDEVTRVGERRVDDPRSENFGDVPEGNEREEPTQPQEVLSQTPSERLDGRTCILGDAERRSGAHSGILESDLEGQAVSGCDCVHEVGIGHHRLEPEDDIRVAKVAEGGVGVHERACRSVAEGKRRSRAHGRTSKRDCIDHGAYGQRRFLFEEESCKIVLYENNGEII